MSASPPSQGGFRWVSYLIMINYVNNSYDNVLKPCDAQKFCTLTQCSGTERLILAHRAGEPKAKGKLPALTYMGVFDKDKYNAHQAPLLSPHGGKNPKGGGTRKAEFMRPTGLLMMDYDHQDPHKVYAALQDYLASTASVNELALAHITPSGDGLRIVLKRAKGKTIAEEQYQWHQRIAKFYDGDLKFDDVCKDISRLSFAPMQSEVLYYNPSLLFAELPEAEDYPDGSLWGGEPLRAALGTPSAPQCSARPSMNRGTVSGATPHPEGEHQQTPPLFIEGVPGGRGRSKQSAEQYPTDYNGVEYSEIIKRLEEQLGGRPEHGARNSFIFSMACNLRYICNDDAAWVASILPTYGEEPQKHRMTIQSAVNRPMSRTMPETLKRALGVAKMCGEGGDSEFKIQNSALEAPALPEVLPPLMDLLVSRSPEKMRAAVAMSVFPPLGAHLRGVEFTYWDGREYEPTFMNVLAAELSAGKSAVNLPIEYIIADIEARDDVARNKEAEWKEKCATLKTTEDKPTRPKGLSVQVLSADMTNAAFVQRLSDAEGKFLYTQMDEIELLDSLKTNTRGGAVSAILRLAFDCGKYGQERVASNAINAKVRVRWNWNASTTIQRVRKYFAGSIADGTLSRLSFATIIKDEDDWGEERPKFAQYGQPFADALAPYIDRLTTCKGTLHCPEAIAWAEQMCDEQVAYAREIDDRTYAQYSYRAVLMGFFRAMVLYIAHGMQWTREIAEFAAWSVRYDLWCKMRFFSDMMHKDMEGERSALQRGPASLLAMLPKEFTREQVRELRMAQGLKPNPSDVLRQWTKRGYIRKMEEQDVYENLRA